jgi:hypothetical protein
MLQMIFQNNDLMDDVYYHNDYRDDYQTHYLYHTYNQKQKVIKKNMNDVCVNTKNEQEEDWGFYVEIDPPTPPKHVFPKKNNTHKHLALNQNPTSNQRCNEYSIQEKNVNYLPQIQEEEYEDQFILDMDLPPDHSNHKTYNEYKEKISQNIFSGLTICALTTASIYFYSKIRSS